MNTEIEKKTNKTMKEKNNNKKRKLKEIINKKEN